jgi:hypothetical protein
MFKVSNAWPNLNVGDSGGSSLSWPAHLDLSLAALHQPLTQQALQARVHSDVLRGQVAGGLRLHGSKESRRLLVPAHEHGQEWAMSGRASKHTPALTRWDSWQGGARGKEGQREKAGKQPSTLEEQGKRRNTVIRAHFPQARHAHPDLVLCQLQAKGLGICAWCQAQGVARPSAKTEGQVASVDR